MESLVVGSTAALLTVAAIRRFVLHFQRKCPNRNLMTGKTVIITGANSGIGKAAALELAHRKAQLILACRTLTAAKETAKQIQTATGNREVIAKELDLASLQSVKTFSQEVLDEVDQIDVLINNAGVFQCPYTKTEDGFEMQMGANHLGHFALTLHLLNKIKHSSPSRVVIVSSALSKRGSINFDDFHSEQTYNKAKAYADSKLANLMFGRELARRLKNTHVDIVCLHPGMVATNLGRHVVNRFVRAILSPIFIFLGLRSASEGGQTLVYCATAGELNGKSGTYVSRDFKSCEYPAQALDIEASARLWELSLKLTKMSYD